MDISNLEKKAVQDLAWLGGFWDADGHISICKRSTYLVAVASCSNTNKALIDNVMRILDAAGITYRLDYQDRGERKNAKPSWTVKMESRPRCLAFLTMIRPYLVGKREQADLVIKHCNLPKGNGPRAGERTDGYWEIKDQLTELNRKGRVRD